MYVIIEIEVMVSFKFQYFLDFWSLQLLPVTPGSSFKCRTDFYTLPNLCITFFKIFTFGGGGGEVVIQKVNLSKSTIKQCWVKARQFTLTIHNWSEIDMIGTRFHVPSVKHEFFSLWLWLHEFSIIINKLKLMTFI